MYFYDLAGYGQMMQDRIRTMLTSRRWLVP